MNTNGTYAKEIICIRVIARRDGVIDSIILLFIVIPHKGSEEELTAIEYFVPEIHRMARRGLIKRGYKLKIPDSRMNTVSYEGRKQRTQRLGIRSRTYTSLIEPCSSQNKGDMPLMCLCVLTTKQLIKIATSRLGAVVAAMTLAATPTLAITVVIRVNVKNLIQSGGKRSSPGVKQ